MKNVLLYDHRGEPIQTSTTIAPDRYLVQYLGGGESAAGIYVDACTALRVSALWKGISLIATAVAKCKTHVYSCEGTTRTINRKHPLYGMVRYSTNRYQRAFDFKQQMTMLMLLYGNAYAWIRYDGRGIPTEMIPIHPSNVQMYVTPSGIFYDAIIYYENGGCENIRVDSSEMLHLTALSRDGWRGIGLLEVAKDVLGEVLAMQSYSGAYFKNSARPDVAIKTPKALSVDAKRAMREDWGAAHSGDRRFGVVILDEQMEMQLVGQDMEKSQFVELRQQAIREVANFLQLPPSKLGDTSRNAYNSLEQDALAALADCYDGHIVNWEEAYNEKLLSTSEQRSGRSEFAFDRSALMSVDLKAESEAFSKALGNNAAWMTPNEVRAIKSMNPIEGGNVLPTPQNAPVEPKGDTEVEPNDDSESETAEALSAQIAESVRRAVTRSVHQAKRGHQSNGLAGALTAIAGDVDGRDEIYRTAVRLLASFTRRDAKVLQSEISARLHGAICIAVSRAGAGEPESFESRLLELATPIAEEIVGHARELLCAA